MLKCLIPIGLLWTVAQAGPVYRWVDANGQVNYSDRPVAGAERIELNTGSPSTVPSHFSTPPPAGAARAVAGPQAGQAMGYESLKVIQPASQETLWGTGGQVDVTLSITPELQPGHRLRLYLDNELAAADASGTQFRLRDVHRGEHTLRAVILDEQRREILRSSDVPFFVQQTSIYYPRNPNRTRSAN